MAVLNFGRSKVAVVISPWTARRSSSFQLLHVAVSRPCRLSEFTPNRASLFVLLSYIITNSGTGTIRFQRELWSVDFWWRQLSSSYRCFAYPRVKSHAICTLLTSCLCCQQNQSEWSEYLSAWHGRYILRVGLHELIANEARRADCSWL